MKQKRKRISESILLLRDLSPERQNEYLNSWRKIGNLHTLEMINRAERGEDVQIGTAKLWNDEDAQAF